MVMLNKEERAKVLDKLAKLLAHTGDGAVNVNEMEIANRKIKELTDEYGISLDELNSIDDKEKLIEMIDVNLHNNNPKMWARSLAKSIADFYECRIVRSKGIFHFIGFNLDAEVAAEIFDRLYYLISGVARIQASNVNDFCFGVVISLRQRLEEITRARERESVRNALVVVKKDAVDERTKKIFPNLVTSKGGKYHKSGDFCRGIQYGKTVEIFKSVGVGERKAEEPKDEFKKRVFKIRRD